MIDLDTAFGEQFLDIAIRQPVPQIPAHRQQDHLRLEPVPSEGSGIGTTAANHHDILTAQQPIRQRNSAPWTAQAARNLLMDWNRKNRFVIRDRAGQFTRTFDNVFAAIGADAIPTPPSAPNANAYAERWVRTVRHELLDRTLIWNQRQLRHLLNGNIEHCNSHRPHRSLDQAAPDHTEPAVPVELNRRIERHSTCSGLINEYRPAA